jgi:hypothetical protein
MNCTSPRFGALYQLSSANHQAYLERLHDMSKEREAKLAAFLDEVSGETGLFRKHDYMEMGDGQGRFFLLTPSGVDDVAAFRRYNSEVCYEKTPAEALSDYVGQNKNRIQYRA